MEFELRLKQEEALKLLLQLERLSFLKNSTIGKLYDKLTLYFEN